MPSRHTHLAGAIALVVLSLAGAGPLAAGANDAYQPPNSGYDAAGSGDVYRPETGSRTDDINQPGQAGPGEGGYRSDAPYDRGGAAARGDSFGGNGAPPSDGYGEPYSQPNGQGQAGGGYPDPKSPSQAGVYEQGEIIGAGHSFFGSISKGIASGIEYVFKSQGRPNGYILGEDAGGAFIIGLRYGEGTLYTKDAGNHKVFWQGPSIGYDAGAEGSKTMVLVYNMHDPDQIYKRFGGVQGAAYLVGGASVQLQKYGDVTLAVIRSGVGLRLGANVGYLKYSRSPTWNPL
jgi:hypothetical protein